MLYTDFQEALTRATERAAAKLTDVPFLTEILQMSYGTDKKTGVIVYRPFYAAAKYLQQSRRDQTIEEADNAKFTGQAVPIESLYALQYALDQDLNIRPAFMIPYPNPSATDLRAGYEKALEFARRFQPLGVV